MRITIKEMLEIQRIAPKLAEANLNIKTAYKVAKLLKNIDSEYTVYVKCVNNILIKYGELDSEGKLIPSGQGYKIQEGKFDVCEEEINSLLNFEIEIPDVQFNCEEFSNLNLTINELFPLLPFIEEDE